MNFSVSVIIPTYNRAHLLPATLDSVLAQTYPAAEIIVVDDGSTDNTKELVRSAYPSVIYKRIDNSGAPKARNVGAGLSTVPWLAFLDSDDVWRSDKLACHARFHLIAPEVEYVFSDFNLVIGGNWTEQSKFEDAPPGFFHDSERIAPGFYISAASLYTRLLDFQPIFVGSFVLTRSLFERVGRWEESLGRTLSEDLEFTLRCCLSSPMGIIKEPLVGIRKHSGNFSGDRIRLAEGEIRVLKFICERHGLSHEIQHQINRQISRRSKDAADLAFSIGAFDLVRQLLNNVPVRDWTLRHQTKGLIARLPRVAAALAHRLTT